MAPQTRVPGVTVPHVAVPHVAAPDVNVPDFPHPHIPGTGAVSDVGHFLGLLGQGETWIRVGEVVLGVLIIGVGLMGLSKTGTAAVKLATPEGKKQFAASIGKAAR